MKVIGAEGPEVPAELVWVAVMVCDPSASGLLGVHVQLPFAWTVAVQMVLLPSDTVTVEPAMPVPLIAGEPVFTVEPSAGWVITGAVGAAGAAGS